MLKKSCNIILATAFSLIVMLFNVGATVMYCSHSHTVKIAMAEDCCNASHDMDQCCGVSSGCMQYQHLKLSPSDNAKIPTKVVLPLSMAALPADRIVCHIAASVRDLAQRDCAWWLTSAQHPPRAYLSKIRVLLI